MKKLALGVVGIVAVSSGFTTPAEAQMGSLGKLAEKLVGKDSSPTTVSGTDVTAVAGPIEKTARLTVLDKQTNRRQLITLAAGQPQTVGALDVKLTKCIPDYAAVLGQDVAWLDVTEASRSSAWFSGWMFNTYPEVSTLDHPRYDVQLQGCGAKARAVVKASASAPIIESSGPIVDTETSGDAPAGDSDPYYVPGVEKGVAPAAPAAPAEAPAAAEPAAGAEPAAQQPADNEAPAATEPKAEPNELHQLMDGTY